MLGIHVLAEAIRSKCRLHGVDYEPILKLVEDVADRGGIPAQDGLGALADIFLISVMVRRERKTSCLFPPTEALPVLLPAVDPSDPVGGTPR